MVAQKPLAQTEKFSFGVRTWSVYGGLSQKAWAGVHLLAWGGTEVPGDGFIPCYMPQTAPKGGGGSVGKNMLGGEVSGDVVVGTCFSFAMRSAWLRSSWAN